MSEISAAMYRAGSGEPVVLLHGFTAAWRIWHPILADLVARYEVIAPTLPGHHGGPSYPADRPITFEQSTDAIEGLLDKLGVGTAHLVGNSMGGGIALELAKRAVRDRWSRWRPLAAGAEATARARASGGSSPGRSRCSSEPTPGVSGS